MVNGSRFYRALESVSMASALSTALSIYPCQIRVHQRWQSKLQLLTARKKEWWPATADSLPQAVTCQHCHTHCVSGNRTHNLPTVSPTCYQLCYREWGKSVECARVSRGPTFSAALWLSHTRKTRESLRSFFARLTRECRNINNLIQHTMNVATAQNCNSRKFGLKM